MVVGEDDKDEEDAEVRDDVVPVSAVDAAVEGAWFDDDADDNDGDGGVEPCKPIPLSRETVVLLLLLLAPSEFCLCRLRDGAAGVLSSGADT